MSRALGWSLGINLAFVLVEFVAGFLANSLALLSDAVHNLTDLPSMAVSLLALHWQRKPADPERTYGYQRSGVLAAFVNALLLVGVALYLLGEAYERIRAPRPVLSQVVLGVAILGVGVNGGIAWALRRGRSDLNLRTIWIHNAGDAASSLGVLAGAVAMSLTGWYVIDPLLSLGIGAAILWSAGGVIRETTHILLEGTPRDLSVEQVARAMLAVPGVAEVHDVHIWSLASNLHALSCHVRIRGEISTRESEGILEQLNRLLAREFRISHTTIQFEPLPRAEARAYLPAEVREKKL